MLIWIQLQADSFDLVRAEPFLKVFDELLLPVAAEIAEPCRMIHEDMENFSFQPAGARVLCDLRADKGLPFVDEGLLPQTVLQPKLFHDQRDHFGRGRQRFGWERLGAENPMPLPLEFPRAFARHHILLAHEAIL